MIELVAGRLFNTEWRSTQMDKINRHNRIIVIALLLAMIIGGLVVMPDYGMPWDEYTEIGVLGSNVR